MGIAMLMETDARRPANSSSSAISLDSYGAAQAARYAQAERFVTHGGLAGLTMSPLGALASVPGIIDAVQAERSRRSVRSIHVRNSITAAGDGMPLGGNSQIGTVMELNRASHGLGSMSRALENPRNLERPGEE